jgi:hypothetical protein
MRTYLVSIKADGLDLSVYVRAEDSELALLNGERAMLEAFPNRIEILAQTAQLVHEDIFTKAANHKLEGKRDGQG